MGSWNEQELEGLDEHFHAVALAGAVTQRRDDGTCVCRGDKAPARCLDQLRSNSCVLNSVRVAKNHRGCSINSFQPSVGVVAVLGEGSGLDLARRGAEIHHLGPFF